VSLDQLQHDDLFPELRQELLKSLQKSFLCEMVFPGAHAYVLRSEKEISTGGLIDCVYDPKRDYDAGGGDSMSSGYQK